METYQQIKVPGKRQTLFISFADWKRSRLLGGVHQSLDANGDKHFHRESCGGGFFCDTPLPTADRRLGRDRNLVSRRNALQSRNLFPGRCRHVTFFPLYVAMRYL